MRSLHNTRRVSLKGRGRNSDVRKRDGLEDVADIRPERSLAAFQYFKETFQTAAAEQVRKHGIEGVYSAEQSLPRARRPRVPRLKLLINNSRLPFHRAVVASQNIPRPAGASRRVAAVWKKFHDQGSLRLLIGDRRCESFEFLINRKHRKAENETQRRSKQAKNTRPRPRRRRARDGRRPPEGAAREIRNHDMLNKQPKANICRGNRSSSPWGRRRARPHGVYTRPPTGTLRFFSLRLTPDGRGPLGAPSPEAFENRAAPPRFWKLWKKNIGGVVPVFVRRQPQRPLSEAFRCRNLKSVVYS
ncbi:hypothetical protein EVAR_41769_1 [Eumeta japonica]|uniref:Uncharacterized protein n=1 Tax=Eumeta variegata TaxID=151549 RepID=A0A4C1VYN6_EUMVA|nr:hypothetical protein EVAR_41769_1 [Eumeta japonica]